ncbi:UDP-N-acetylmuramoyl-L-alanyl-D-glutamate--2,6-diaminopimelate ligase [Virgibacillus kekensis]|uniref:UDP-N-acetylmuramyl-tripeptide synthetase n=1 Tax=Virgibacillus kekensis TaxID=202261 RepID=A0ABV9DKP9_9BACI
MDTRLLLSCLKVKKIYGRLPEKINNLEQDSRKVNTGDLFICTPGFTVDGHDFYEEALSNGASIIVSERHLEMDLNSSALIVVNDTKKAMALLANKFYDYPSSKMTAYGVTGTNGKTSVTTLMHAMLRKEGKTAALSGTNGIKINDEMFPSDNTTCDILTNQRELKKAVTSGVENMVMEVSSHGIEQGRLHGIDFDVVTFTNLSHEHLDYHHTMEKYGYTKGLLFAQLGNNLQNAKIVVLNRDDPWYSAYKGMTAYEVISYGIKEDANFFAENILYNEDGTHYTLHSPEGTYQVETSLLGEFNVYNSLAAIASLYADGYSVSELVTILKTVAFVPGRMEKVEINAPATVYLDYAHTPDAIEKSIQSVLPFKKRKIIFVAGTGGDRDKGKRPFMAEKASKADYVILTINDPRYEDTEEILRAMEKGMQHNSYVLIADRREAISHAIELAEPDDIVIVAGKGPEDYQIIGGEKLPHNDIEIIKESSAKKYAGFVSNTD